jgi:hypothetical protein
VIVGVQVEYNETKGGLVVKHGLGGHFTPEELVAMVLTHATDITKAYGVRQRARATEPTRPDPTGTDRRLFVCLSLAPTHQGHQVRDAVLITPSFLGQHERQALLDAADIADINVLSVRTASPLALSCACADPPVGPSADGRELRGGADPGHRQPLRQAHQHTLLQPRRLRAPGKNQRWAGLLRTRGGVPSAG